MSFGGDGGASAAAAAARDQEIRRRNEEFQAQENRERQISTRARGRNLRDTNASLAQTAEMEQRIAREFLGL